MIVISVYEYLYPTRLSPPVGHFHFISPHGKLGFLVNSETRHTGGANHQISEMRNHTFTRHTAFTHQGLSGFDARINDLNEAAHARLTPNLRCRWKVLMEELLHANSLSNLYLVRSRSRRTVKRCTRAR